MADDVIKKSLDEAYELGVKHCIGTVENMDCHPVNDNSAAFFWGIERDELLLRLKQLLSNPNEQPQSLITNNSKTENT